MVDVSAATPRKRTKTKPKTTRNSATKLNAGINVMPKKATKKPTGKKAAGTKAARKNAVKKVDQKRATPKKVARKRRPNT